MTQVEVEGPTIEVNAENILLNERFDLGKGALEKFKLRMTECFGWETIHKLCKTHDIQISLVKKK